MDISDRIKSRMKQLNLRAADVVLLTKVSKGTVSQWVNGIVKPGGENLLLLSKALKVNPEWIQNGSERMEEVTLTEGPAIKGRFPLLNWVQAGSWTEVIDNLSEAFEYFPCPASCSNSTFVLKVSGISMDPVFREGDLVFVDPEAEWKNNSFVVVRSEHKNEATLKQLIIEDGDRYLKPANPNWPVQIIPIGKEHSIVGVVVFSGRMF
jgi:SOS-response transcriptional repressor LexA